MILDSESNIKLYTEQGWWDEVTIIDYLLRNVEVSPDMVCLVDPPNRTNFTVGEPKRLTWAEVKRAVDNLATGLLELGVKKDSVIQLQMPNITEAPIVYLAAARIGAIVSPLAVQYRDHEVGYAMGLVEPTVYITTTNFNGFNFVDMVEKLRKDVPSLKAIIALGDNLPEGVLSLTEIIARDTDGKALEDYLSKTTLSAYEIFTICWTSGTEATPKGVPRSQNSWKVVSLSLIDPCGIEEEDNLILTFPLINMASLAGNFFPWLSQRCKLTLHHPFDLKVFLQQIKDEKINHFSMAPALANMILQRTDLYDQIDFSTIKSVRSGAAPLSPWMVKGFQDRGIYIFNSFGSNEGCSLFGTHRELPDPEDRALYFPRWGAEGFEWAYRCAKAVHNKLVDSEGNIITERGVIGELYIKGPGVFPGYYKRPDLNEKSFDKDGWFATGDLFSIEGENLDKYKFQGRSKDIIIRGGFNISAEEIENKIIANPKVAEVAVVGYPDERLGEKVCACVVPVKGETVTLEDIIESLGDVAIYKRPEKLLVLDSLPRNPLNKLLKKDLRVLAAQN